MAKPDVGAQTLSLDQASALLGRSVSWISQRKSSGYFGESPKGYGIALVALIRGSIAYYEDERQKGLKANTANAASQARTDKMHLEMAIRRRDLIPLSDAESVLVEFAGQVRSGIAGIPAAATRDPAARAAVLKACDDTLRSLADRAAEAGLALAPDRGDAAAIGSRNAG